MSTPPATPNIPDKPKGISDGHFSHSTTLAATTTTTTTVLAVEQEQHGFNVRSTGLLTVSVSYAHRRRDALCIT